MYAVTVFQLVLAFVSSSLSLFDCGPDCRCEDVNSGVPPMKIRAVCSGNGLHSVPEFDSNLAPHVFVLGLARNFITQVFESDLVAFPNLEVIDLRNQGGCVNIAGNFPESIRFIEDDKCKPTTPSKGGILDSLKKHLPFIVPIVVAMNPSSDRNRNFSEAFNETFANTTIAPSTTTRSALLSGEQASEIMTLLERFRQALIAGGHTTLALIIYSIITTIGILSILTVICKRCKKRCRTVQVSSGLETDTSVQLQSLSETEQQRSRRSSVDSWPLPPPPEPAVLNLESDTSDRSDTSSEELFNRQSLKLCPTVCSRSKEHEA